MLKVLIALCCIMVSTWAITTHTINKEMDMVIKQDMMPTITEKHITTTETTNEPTSIEEIDTATEEYIEAECTTYTNETEPETTMEYVPPTVSETSTEDYTSTESSTEEDTTQVDSYVFSVTGYERELLARVVYLEANIESFDCQAAVTSVIFNRLLSGYWGNSLYDVLYAKNQFSTIYSVEYVTPNATNYAAVDYVLENGCTLPYYVMYFRAGYHFQWNGYAPYTVINNTYFGYMTKDK